MVVSRPPLPRRLRSPGVFSPDVIGACLLALAVSLFVGAVGIAGAGSAGARTVHASAPDSVTSTGPSVETTTTTTASAGQSTTATTGESTTAPTESTRVEVIEVSGLIDRIQERFVMESLDRAVQAKSEALVIQLDSGGSVLSSAELDRFEETLRNDHRIPIAVWVGPTGARASGGAVRLVRAADVVGMAPVTRIGRSTPPPVGTDTLQGVMIDQREALKTKVATIDAPVLRFFVAALDDLQIDGHSINTASPVLENGTPVIRNGLPVRDVIAQPVFIKLGLIPRLLHTVSNPSIAYLLLIIGLALMVFEFFTGGVGVAASVGIGSAALAAFGLGALPINGVGLALLLLALFGFSVDVQAGVPRVWTAIALVAFLAGSLLLYRQGLRVPWYWIAIVGFLVAVFMTNGMPSMVRTRFATPTIGRASMIGEIGHVAGDGVKPEGVVVVRGAPWRARTNRATPIPAGSEVKVVAIDGLLLEVEPLEGAAKDAGH